MASVENLVLPYARINVVVKIAQLFLCKSKCPHNHPGQGRGQSPLLSEKDIRSKVNLLRGLSQRGQTTNSGFLWFQPGFQLKELYPPPTSAQVSRQIYQRTVPIRGGRLESIFVSGIHFCGLSQVSSCSQISAIRTQGC